MIIVAMETHAKRNTHPWLSTWNKNIL